MYQVKCKRRISQQDKQPGGKNPLQPRFLCHKSRNDQHYTNGQYKCV